MNEEQSSPRSGVEAGSVFSSLLRTKVQSSCTIPNSFICMDPYHTGPSPVFSVLFKAGRIALLGI